MALIVNGRFLRVQPTGMQRVARTLVAELRAGGHRIEVVAPRGIEDPLVDRTVGGPPGRFGDTAWEQTVLPAVAGRAPVFSPTNLAPLLTGRSIVWTHDLAPLVNPAWFAGRQARLYGRMILAAARRARCVFVPSAEVGAQLRAAGVGADRVRVLRSPVDPRFHHPAAPDVARVRARYELRRDYVVHVGCHDPRKDAPFAVAAHLAAARVRAHDLVLVGRSHPVFPPVRWPQAPSVRPVGYVADEDLVPLLGGASALLFPSRYEGFGLPPLEAIGCGTPALVSDIPVHRETAGKLAELLPLDDTDAWAGGIRRALAGELPVPPLPAWTATDMAGQFLAALPAWAAAVL